MRRIRFPWFTLTATRPGRSRARCYAAMLGHEALHLLGVDPHVPGAVGYAATVRYGIGVPDTIPPPGLRGTYRVIGSDVPLAEVPVVDAQMLAVFSGDSTARGGAIGDLIGWYRGNAAKGAWEPISNVFGWYSSAVYDADTATVAVTFSTPFGIDAGTGVPYFDPGNVTSGEEAVLLEDLSLVQPGK